MVNIKSNLIGKLTKGKYYQFTRRELYRVGASQFKTGNTIKVSRYLIHIDYGNYEKPSHCSWLEDLYTLKSLDCTPGKGTPYYIDDFKGR